MRTKKATKTAQEKKKIPLIFSAYPAVEGAAYVYQLTFEDGSVYLGKSKNFQRLRARLSHHTSQGYRAIHSKIPVYSHTSALKTVNVIVAEDHKTAILLEESMIKEALESGKSLNQKIGNKLNTEQLQELKTRKYNKRPTNLNRNILITRKNGTQQLVVGCSEAAAVTGALPSNICAVLRGDLKTTKGFRFKELTPRQAKLFTNANNA